MHFWKVERKIGMKGCKGRVWFWIFLFWGWALYVIYGFLITLFKKNVVKILNELTCRAQLIKLH